MNKTKKGFTLIELLIVIAIIGILAVAFLPSLLGAPSKGRDTTRVTTIEKLSNFITSESLSGTALPGASATGEVQCVDSAGAAGTIGKLVSDNLPDFGGVFPLDPQSDATSGNQTVVDGVTCTGKYVYIRFKAGLKYTAGAVVKMENIPENANIQCSAIKKNDTNYTLVKGAANNDCFLALIQ